MPNGIWRSGDFNGDGRTDLLHAVKNQGIAYIWTSNGNGTFDIDLFKPRNDYEIPNGIWKTGDFNGDGKTDIFHIVENKDYVNVWLAGVKGYFRVVTFRPWEDYPVDDGTWRVSDFDQDGKTDIFHALATDNRINIWNAEMAGRFQIQSYLPWEGYDSNGQWLSGDFSGDGKMDLFHAPWNQNFAHVWVSAQAGPGELSIDGIEITQAVQDMDHSVPLIAGKPTVVRTYLNFNGPQPIGVKGKLEIRELYPNQRFVTVKSENSTLVESVLNNQLVPKRLQTQGGLNFRVPDGFNVEGVYAYRLVELEDEKGNLLSCSDCELKKHVNFFREPLPLRLRLVGIRYQSGAPSSVYVPGTRDMALIESWLSRAYPVGSLQSSRINVDASEEWPFSCSRVNAQLAAMRRLDIDNGADFRTHYYGVVSDGAGFMRGCAAGIPQSPNPAIAASGPTGSATWGWDEDGSYGDWYAGHELGHTYGRFHIGSGCGETSDDPNFPFPNGQLSDLDNAFVGFDTGEPSLGIPMAALPGIEWKDVMSYCRYQWLSSYTYLKILERLAAEDDLIEPEYQLVEKRVAYRVSDEQLQNALIAIPDTEAITPFAEKEPQAYTALLKPQLPYNDEVNESSIPAFALKPVQKALPGKLYKKFPPDPEYAAPPRMRMGLQPLSVNDILKTTVKVDSLPKRKINAVEGEYINIVGVVNLSEVSGEIQYVTKLKRYYEENYESEYAITLIAKNAKGSTLGTYTIPVKLRSDADDIGVLEGVIDAVIPANAQYNSIELMVLGEIVSAYKAPPAQVREQNKQIGNELTISSLNNNIWDISWLGRKAATYTVLISEDGGGTFQTVGLALKQNNFQVDSRAFPGAQNLNIKVLINDGFDQNELNGTLAR